MDWAYLTPDDVPGSGGRVFALVPALLEVITEADWPLDMAVFIESDYATEADAALYFSPAATRALGDRFPELRPCHRPDHAAVGLLVGDPDCRSALYPGHVVDDVGRAWLND